MGLLVCNLKMCNALMKLVLCLISVATILIGAGLIFLPFHYGYKFEGDFKKEDIDANGTMKNLPNKIINFFRYNVIFISYLSFGIVTVLTGLIGCFAISKNNCFARWLYCTLTFAMVVITACSIYISNNYHNDIFSFTEDIGNLSDMTKQVIIPEVMKPEMQEIQTRMKCCGFITPTETENSCYNWNKNSMIDDVCSCDHQKAGVCDSPA